MLWGLTHGGEKGAIEVLKLIKEDIRQTLALAGKLNQNIYELKKKIFT